jgi:hypothetical protein
MLRFDDIRSRAVAAADAQRRASARKHGELRCIEIEPDRATTIVVAGG